MRWASAESDFAPSEALAEFANAIREWGGTKPPKSRTHSYGIVDSRFVCAFCGNLYKREPVD
jgi:hypothetical protein